jgi:hypothetical protein
MSLLSNFYLPEKKMGPYVTHNLIYNIYFDKILNFNGPSPKIKGLSINMDLRLLNVRLLNINIDVIRVPHKGSLSKFPFSEPIKCILFAKFENGHPRDIPVVCIHICMGVQLYNIMYLTH